MMDKETEEALVTQLRESIRLGVERTGGVRPRFYVANDTEIDIILVEPPDAMNSASAKDAIYDAVRARVKERRATLVAFVSEAWMAHQTEAQRLLQAVLEQASGLNFSIEQLDAIGLADQIAQVAILCIDTPLRTYQLNFPFERKSDGGIEWGEETFFDSAQPGVEIGGKTRFFDVDLKEARRA